MPTISHHEQSSKEEITYPLDFSPQLFDGDTVDSCACTHTPPSGGAATVSPTVVNGIVYVPVPDSLVVGVHLFSCVATTSNANNSPEILLVITVPR